MKESGKLLSNIVDVISQSEDKPLLRKEIMRYVPREGYMNELLFMVKPEVTRGSGQAVGSVLDMVFRGFDRYGVIITGCVVLSGRYLKRHDIMAKHYGVINEVSFQGRRALSDKAINELIKYFAIDNIQSANIKGAFEFLSEFAYFDEFSLNALWESQHNYKLASGIYATKVTISGEQFILLNGFHHYQLLHFTREDATVIILTMETNSHWCTLRREMIGATDPSKAAERSIRRNLLDRRADLGLSEISQGYNGVHLSAGPIESTAEVARFMSNYDDNIILSVSDTLTGKYMVHNGVGNKLIEYYLSNPVISIGDRLLKIYDFTEEMDTNECLNALRDFELPEVSQ